MKMLDIFWLAKSATSFKQTAPVLFVQELVELYPLDGTSFPAKLIRYVGMPTGGFKSERNEGDVVVMSLWNGKRDIVNINLLAEDSKQAMLLLSAVTRLVYESAGKNSPRTHKFYPIEEGPVDVASCSTAKRDKMDVEKERKGLVRKQKSGGKCLILYRFTSAIYSQHIIGQFMSFSFWQNGTN